MLDSCPWDSDISSAALQRLLGLGKSVLSDLVADGIIVRGEKRGSYLLEPSVTAYCRHLREQVAGRGGATATEARAKLGEAQGARRRWA